MESKFVKALKSLKGNQTVLIGSNNMNIIKINKRGKDKFVVSCNGESKNTDMKTIKDVEMKAKKVM